MGPSSLELYRLVRRTCVEVQLVNFLPDVVGGLGWIVGMVA